MKLFSKLLLAGFIAVIPTLPALAGADDVDKIRAALKKTMPKLQLTKEAIQPSPVPGLYLVMIPPDLFYISADGRYLFDGELIDVKSKSNISESVRGRMRLSVVDSVGEKNMIIYGPKKAKHTITVFTDIDCGYCRKLHNEIGAYNDAGIRVRYLAYPRAGIGSESYNKAVSVWCADDPAKALTEAKQGTTLPKKVCANPVEMEYKLGTRLGLRGTPAIVTDQGRLIPGYVPASQLKAMLEQTAK